MKSVFLCVSTMLFSSLAFGFNLEDGKSYYVQTRTGEFFCFDASAAKKHQLFVGPAACRAKIKAIRRQAGDAVLWYLQAPNGNYISGRAGAEEGEAAPGVTLESFPSTWEGFIFHDYDHEIAFESQEHHSFLSADEGNQVPETPHHLVNMRPEDGGWERFRFVDARAADEEAAAAAARRQARSETASAMLLEKVATISGRDSRRH